jgi:hypothetical protein
VKRTKLSESVKWNGDDRTFSRYEDNIVSWTLQIGMGYLMRPDFLDAYRKYQWIGAQHYARHIVTEQFLLDNEVLFGALMSSAQQRGSRYVKDHKVSRDGLAVWIKFKDIFGGDNNLPLKIQRLLDTLDEAWNPNYEGGFLAYIDNIVHIYNQLDIEDPTYQLHQESTDKIKCTTIRNRFAHTEYSDTTYAYYDDMEQANKFDVELYIKRLTKYHQHKEQISYTNARAKAHMISSNNQSGIVPVNIDNQEHNILLTNQGDKNNAYTDRPKGFLLLTNDEFRTLANKNKELAERFRNTRIEVSELLYPPQSQLQTGNYTNNNRQGTNANYNENHKKFCKCHQ